MLGKTWLTALYCVIKCILYPGTKIVVAAGNKSEAMKIVTEKIPELISKSTTHMLEREIKGVIRTNMNTDAPNVEFNDGSWIKIVAANEGARSGRANLLILDEFRLIEPKIYKSVLRRFLAASRQPGYLSKLKYKNKQEYLEENQEIFLTSCFYKTNWSYQRYQVFIKNMLKGMKYFVCGLPYQFAIKENLSNKKTLLEEASEEDFDLISWQMEMCCQFFGESEKAFFKTEELTKVRNIYEPIYPKPFYDLLNDKKFKYVEKKIREKGKEKEIRILSCDIAIVGGKKNDASVFTLIQLIPQYNRKDKFNGFTKTVRYMEVMNGMHPELQAIRIRQLYDDLDCDYIVLDRAGNGLSVYASLCKDMYDRERGEKYDAFNSMNEEEMQKLCLVSGAKKCIYTLQASSQFNSTIAYALKNDIVRGKLKLLVDKNESFEYLGKLKEFSIQKSGISAKLQLPYYQTDSLINEMVQLESEVNEQNSQLKLKEQSGKRKDRYTSLAYGNYFANKLERKMLKKNKDIDINDYCKSNILDNQQINNNISPFGNNFKNPFGNSMNRRVF